MKSKEGSTLGGVGLRKGRIKQVTGGGAITPASTFVCHADGDLLFTFDDDSTETISWVANDAFAVEDLKSITINSGTFSIGFD